MGRMKIFSFTVATASMLIGCGTTNLTTTGPAQEPRPNECEFDIYTTLPEHHVEVGTLDVEPGGYGHNVYTKLDEFKNHIRPYVCRAGGDAALALANGYGMYVKATILKRNLRPKESSPEPEETFPPSLNASSPDKTGTAGGCSYDTQCKGDRVCVEGKCVDPS